MGFSAEIVDVDKAMATLRRKFGKLTKEAEQSIIMSNKLLALRIHELAIKSIQDQRGTPGIRYKGKRKVTVSKPGAPPNTDTGRLVQSISFEFREGGLIAIVGTGLNYGSWLEFGTKKMAARPWLLPAVRQAQRELGRRAYIKNANVRLKKAAKK